MKKSTQCVHSGTYFDEKSGGVNTPIFTSTAYNYSDEGAIPYPRYFNTINQEVVAQKIAALERGEAALIFSSGMAATMTALLGVLQAGDHLILQNDIYGGTHYAVREQLSKLGIESTFVEGKEIEDFKKAIKPNSKALLIETPSNPLLSIVDIAEMANFAKENNLISFIDNTFGTPIFQNPLRLGIDIVIHSGTKYLAGHSDLSCGAVVTSQKLIEKIHHVAFNFGGNLDAMATSLLERSLKTLAIRVKTQAQNAQKIAEALQKLPQVKNVFYPGLPTHPDHELAKKQMKGGFGGMLSFELDTNKEGRAKFVRHLELVCKAVSLGGVESTLTEPVLTSHAKVPVEMRERMGITENLYRLSVGIEDAEDLIEDLTNAIQTLEVIEKNNLVV